MIITYKNRLHQATNPLATLQTNSLQKFRQFTEQHKNSLLIGYLSYDLTYDLLKISQTATNDLKLPKIYFQAFDPKNLKKYKPPKPQTNPKDSLTKFTPQQTKSEYNAAYRKIQTHIKKGNIYQINLTHRLHATTNLQDKEIFHRLHQINPAAHAALIETPKFALISASPETFIKVELIKAKPSLKTLDARPEGNFDRSVQNSTRGSKFPDNTADEVFSEGFYRIITKPIKGTNLDPQTLLKSPKEAAELNMITDLLRNDIGRVAKPATVQLKAHRQLLKTANIWHTYSEIHGRLATDPITALLSMLPAGSITGCPKKRACQIIDQLEPTTRGIYTGVIGYIEPKTQNLQFAVAIRTIIKKGKNLYLQVGGGIVLDSNPEDEFQETLHKAASFQKLTC